MKKITEAAIREVLPFCSTRLQILKALEVGICAGNYDQLEKIANEAGISLPLKKNRGLLGNAGAWNFATLSEAASRSSSLGEVLDYLGLSARSHQTVRRAAKRLGVKLPKVSPAEARAAKITPEATQERLRNRFNTYFQNEKKIDGARAKEVLFGLGVLKEECSICGCGPEWNGIKLVLQLDHKNGINTDNRIENIRIVCPNCHSQTHTYAGRNKGSGSYRHKSKNK